MRLISCYVQGYGKIKQKEYLFNRGVTSFCEENGAGKTTLASFIKAMFYGLEGYRKGSTEFCDREHFYPFDGSRFGGTLTFEMEGRIYKIERFFGDKSKTADTLRVYADGEEYDGFGEEIGKTVFGMDRASFERTVFLESGDVEMKPTSGIHAKLNAFLEGGSEEEDLGAALSRLEKAAKVYKKSRVGNDKVSEQKAKIDRLKADIENASASKRALEGKYARDQALQEEIEGINGRIVRGQKENERASDQAHYQTLFAARSKAEKGLLAIEERYPLGLPTEEECAEIADCVTKEQQMRATASGTAFTAREEERLAALENTFRFGVPTEEKLLAVEQDARTLTALETEKKLYSGKGTSEKESKLIRRFAHGVPTRAELSAAEEKLTAYKKAQNALERIPAWVQSSARTEKAPSKKYKLLAILAVLLLAVGGVVCLAQLAVGIGVLAVGGVVLLADGFAYLNKKSAPVALENPERKGLEKELVATEDGLKAFLLPYGYHSGEGLAFDLASLKKDAADYEEFCKASTERQAKLEENERAQKELSNRLTKFFQTYGLTGDAYAKLLSDLRVRIESLATLTERKKGVAERLRALEEERTKYAVKLEGYKNRYGLVELSPKRVEGDVKEYARLRAELASATSQAENYRKEKGLTEGETLVKVDLDALNGQLRALQEEKSNLKKEIDEGEAIAEKLEDYEEEKKVCEALVEEYKRKNNLMNAASELLKCAEGRLRDKYVKPIKDEFLHYAELLERALGEKVVMTKEFELRFERQGELRSEKHLSAGQRSVCALCFRLALIKNMYRGQLPFLVLDDPFTSLDDEHLGKVTRLLQELSKDMQMIYFTCHESRRI